MGRVLRPRHASINTIEAQHTLARHRKADHKKPSYKVIIEEISEKKLLKTSRAFNKRAPRGYTFIPAGDPQLTDRLKHVAREDGSTVYIVSDSKFSKALSNEVGRIGYHFSSSVVDKACASLGVTLTAAGRVEQSHFADLKEDLPNRGNGRKSNAKKDRKFELDAPQAVIDTQAREAIKDLFPKIPADDLHSIIAHSFQKGANFVGTASDTPLVRRAQLAVLAYIRHRYTNYDDLLKLVEWDEARRRIEHRTLDKLLSWRDDADDDTDMMRDVLREVIVLDDDEASDGKTKIEGSPESQLSEGLVATPVQDRGRGERKQSEGTISTRNLQMRAPEVTAQNLPEPLSEQRLQYVPRPNLLENRLLEHRRGTRRQQKWQEAVHRQRGKLPVAEFSDMSQMGEVSNFDNTHGLVGPENAAACALHYQHSYRDKVNTDEDLHLNHASRYTGQAEDVRVAQTDRRFRQNIHAEMRSLKPVNSIRQMYHPPDLKGERLALLSLDPAQSRSHANAIHPNRLSLRAHPRKASFAEDQGPYELSPVDLCHDASKQACKAHQENILPTVERDEAYRTYEQSSGAHRRQDHTSVWISEPSKASSDIVQMRRGHGPPKQEFAVIAERHNGSEASMHTTYKTENYVPVHNDDPRILVRQDAALRFHDGQRHPVKQDQRLLHSSRAAVQASAKDEDVLSLLERPRPSLEQDPGARYPRRALPDRKYGGRRVHCVPGNSAEDPPIWTNDYASARSPREIQPAFSDSFDGRLSHQYPENERETAMRQSAPRRYMRNHVNDVQQFTDDVLRYEQFVRHPEARNGRDWNQGKEMPPLREDVPRFSPGQFSGHAVADDHWHDSHDGTAMVHSARQPQPIILLHKAEESHGPVIAGPDTSRAAHAYSSRFPNLDQAMPKQPVSHLIRRHQPLRSDDSMHAGAIPSEDGATREIIVLD